MWPIDCIEHKRDGKILTKEEISRFITDYTAGRVADYQAARQVVRNGSIRAVCTVRLP